MATVTRREPPAEVVEPERRPRPPLRDRLLPRTVIGISVMILAFAVGAALSGTVFYAYYDYRLGTNEQRIQTFTAGFDQRFKDATDTIAAERETAKEEIRKELEPIKKIRAEGETLQDLVKKVQQSVWFVTTLDEAGQPSVGSAFVVASDGEQALMVTSFATVRAAARSPGPPVKIRKGEEELAATLHTWHEERDLALLIVKKSGLPKLTFGAASNLKTGERIFSVSGLGAAGGAISQGFIADVSGAGIQHDAAVGSAFQGGPLLNDKGEVLAVASRAYAPLGFTTEGVYFGVPIAATCEKVLKCPEGGDPSAGAKP
ncbi:MAG TPA: serine protease [Acidimicrobiales bacterium]|nr:serine protease [Acidimicrobiales bacterium]